MPSVYAAALDAHPHGYFSHLTAAYLHNLTIEEPEVVYYNIEQTPKPAGIGTLRQSNIDAAFSRPARISNSRALFDSTELCILSGKWSDNLGVVETVHPRHARIRLTDLERTLIDLVVRPTYSGGALTVFDAFARAASKITLDKLIDTLLRLEHRYPYHQALGFYLERSCHFGDKALDAYRELGLNYDFYLDYKLELPTYCPRWRVYYPRELKNRLQTD